MEDKPSNCFPTAIRLEVHSPEWQVLHNLPHDYRAQRNTFALCKAVVYNARLVTVFECSMEVLPGLFVYVPITVVVDSIGVAVMSCNFAAQPLAYLSSLDVADIPRIKLKTSHHGLLYHPY